eukprot:COSAG02_NODE_24306_length_692_cov_1.121417_1_plen_54_part_10
MLFDVQCGWRVGVLVHFRPEIKRGIDAVFRNLVDQCPDLRTVTLPLRVPPLLPL